MRIRRILLSIGLLALGCASESTPKRGTDGRSDPSIPQSMTVFCGSASKPAMEEITEAFQKQTGVEVNTIFGGSGTLLSQIALAKKGEIYIPGSPDYISIGLKKKLLIPGSDQKVVYLVPSIITPADNPAGIERIADLAKPGVRVGIGNPKSVCLGLYSVELLEKAGLIERVLPNVVTFAGSCSKTANLASLSQVDAILGWRVFAAWNPNRMKAIPIEPALVPRISYVPIAIPVHTRSRELSDKFISFVLSDKGRAAYQKFGYISSKQKAMALAPNAGIGGEYALPGEYFRWAKERMKH